MTMMTKRMRKKKMTVKRKRKWSRALPGHAGVARVGAEQ
jgi:hypothetical protein